jgi:4-amino-4-deoxy-L-arabinose transferase-like glycosyltransferase
VRLLFFLPGFFNIPPIDRDEARFAQATKQMVETGDFVDIRFQDEVRYKKPVGIYWLQAAAVETAPRSACRARAPRIWLYRIPSLIGAIGAVLLTYWTALAFVTRRGAMLAGLMMAVRCCSAPKRGSPRPTPCCCSPWSPRWARWRGSICPGSAARIPRIRHGAWPAIFWTALAGGILLKGPLILMFVGLTIGTLAILDRSARWLWGCGRSGA